MMKQVVVVRIANIGYTGTQQTVAFMDGTWQICVG